jgi:hypothetical protein
VSDYGGFFIGHFAKKLSVVEWINSFGIFAQRAIRRLQRQFSRGMIVAASTQISITGF